VGTLIGQLSSQHQRSHATETQLFTTQASQCCNPLIIHWEVQNTWDFNTGRYFIQTESLKKCTNALNQ